MKKKLITLTLTALMVMTMAACGDKPTESTGNSAAESETESTQEVSAKIEDETGETDVAEDDTENSAVSEPEETETADATESEPVEIDWDNMDWTQAIFSYSGTTPDPVTGEETEWENSITYGSLLYMANTAEETGDSLENIFNNDIMVDGRITYDQLDNETKALAEAISNLTTEERNAYIEVQNEQFRALGYIVE